MLGKSKKEKLRREKKEKANKQTGKSRDRSNSLKRKAIKYYNMISEQIKKSIRLEILYVVGIAFTIAFVTFFLVDKVINHTSIGSDSYISYEQSRREMESSLLEIVRELNALEEDEIDEEGQLTIESIIERGDNSYWTTESSNYLVDGAGKLLYKDSYIESLDLIKVIQKSGENGDDSPQAFYAVYPVSVNDQVCYLINQSTLRGNQMEYYNSLGKILGFIAAVGTFVLILFREIDKKIAYIEYLSECLGEIAKGDLSYKIEIVGKDELAQVARDITKMEDELNKQIDAQIRAEQSKNELVSNVAHDLRTPLTSIIGYIGLLKDKAYKTKEEQESYLNIAYSKSEKLKDIIEDLFELTKLYQNVGGLNKTRISLNNLLNQLIEELMPLAKEKEIDIEAYIDEHNIMLEADATKIIRVFENLIENAIKYTEVGESIYVEVKAAPHGAYIAVSNPCQDIKAEEVSRLFERFYRRDEARNSEIGGSGLGLAIAKNIVDLHGGAISAKLLRDLISFKVYLPTK